MEQNNNQPIPIREKKHEYSKIIVGIISASWVVVFIYALIYGIVTVDSMIVSDAIDSSEKLAMVIILAYLWKARAENLIKLKKIYGKDADTVIKLMMKDKSPDEDTSELDTSLNL